jgi:hypothetical protein
MYIVTVVQPAATFLSADVEQTFEFVNVVFGYFWVLLIVKYNLCFVYKGRKFGTFLQNYWKKLQVHKRVRLLMQGRMYNIHLVSCE